jgi:hypothetical protein
MSEFIICVNLYCNLYIFLDKIETYLSFKFVKQVKFRDDNNFKRASGPWDMGIWQ